MAYRPLFTRHEFHHNTGHYEINLGGRKILYAYIRKNACTAFRRLLNDEYHRLHPSTDGARQRKREDFLLSGNMKTFLVLRKDLNDVSAYDNTMFVYRNPLDRLISVFTNKFIANKGAKDIARNFENLTGLDFDEATFSDFMSYAQNDFEKLDRHLWPQKAHLWDIEYTDAISMDRLQQSMKGLIGGRHIMVGQSERAFGPPHSARGRVEPGKGLRRGHFVQQVKIDVQERLAIVFGNGVRIPYLVIERAGQGHGARQIRPSVSRRGPR